MAESYFELLTEQEGIPAKPFDPVIELKRLRRGLTVRMQTSEPPKDEIAEMPLFQTKEKIKGVSSPPCESVSPETETISLESVMNKTGEMKKTLAMWQRSRQRTRPVRNDIFRGNRKPRIKRRSPLVVAQFLTAHQEETLETVNAGLMALGIVGIVFGVLSLIRGLESDVSIGSLVFATGAAIVMIGLGGRFLASRTAPKRYDDCVAG